MALKTSIQNVCKRLGYSVQELPNIIKVLQEGFADVATEAGDVDTAVSDVGTLKTRMTTAEGKIETLEQGDVYSTTEHVVGKWIDESDIYEKTIETGALPNATIKNIEHNIENIGYIISIDGTATNGTIHLTLNTPVPGGGGSILPISTYATATEIRINTQSDYSAYTTSYVTMRYTKSAEPSRQPDEPTDHLPEYLDEPVEK